MLIYIRIKQSGRYFCDQFSREPFSADWLLHKKILFDQIWGMSVSTLWTPLVTSWFRNQFSWSFVPELFDLFEFQECPSRLCNCPPGYLSWTIISFISTSIKVLYGQNNVCLVVLKNRFSSTNVYRGARPVGWHSTVGEFARLLRFDRVLVDYYCNYIIAISSLRGRASVGW